MVFETLSIVAAAFVLAATPPAGFREAPRLEPAASFVAGKPVTVLCSTTKAAFTAAHPATHDVAGFVPQIGDTEMWLRSDTCAYLLAWLNHRRVEEYDFAASALTLAHESTHLRGETDEGVTDCAALAKLPAMFRRFFPSGKGRASVSLLMLYARDVHQRKPAAYLVGCP